MKQVIYFLMSIISLTGTITGTIKLCSLVCTKTDIVPIFCVTLLSMGTFILFGYAFKHSLEK